MGFCVFFVIHIAQVAHAGWNNFRSMVAGHEVIPAKQPSYAAMAPRHRTEDEVHE
jgi:hypothetical protein